MPRRTQAESEATARRVLETATALFAAEGYAAVGLERVAAAAGVTRGAVYHHFAAKPALFEAVLAGVQERVGAAVASAAAAAPGGWPAIEAGCRAFLDAATDDAHRRILLIDGPAVLGWNAWRAHDAAHSVVQLEAGLRERASSGELADGLDPVAVAALLSGALNEAALWIAAADDPDAAAEAAWAGVRRLLAAIAAAPPLPQHPSAAR